MEKTLKQLVPLLFCLPLCWTLNAGELFLNQPLYPLPPGWMNPWWSTQKFDLKPENGGNAFLLRDKTRNAWTLFDFLCDNMIQEFDLSSIPADDLSVCFDSTLNTWLRLIVRDGNRKAEVDCKKPEPLQNGFFRYRFPLNKAKTPIRYLSGVSIQFPEKLADPTVKIQNFGICSPRKTLQIPLAAKSKELKKIIGEAGKLRIAGQDRYIRPEIRNGTWFMNGHYLFQLGPNTSVPSKSLEQENCYMRDKHIAYRKYADKEVLDSLGFNSSHFAVPNRFYTPAMGYGIKRDFKQTTEIITTFLKKQEQTPLNVDFAFVNSESFRFAFPDRAKRMAQKNPNWCYFIPFCPDSVEGREFYRNCFRIGTSSLLKTGVNPFVYELFNESRYNCACSDNKKIFAEKMHQKYGTVQAANRRWKTSFSNFDGIQNVKDFTLHPRMIPDWHEFASSRYAEVLKEGRETIRSIDRRSNVHVTEQCSQGAFLHSFGAIGMDYRKIATVVDTLGSEGGWRSYGYGSIKYGGIMEDAATSGNCYSYIADIYQTLSKGEKPIMNHEHYCARFHDGKRVPSKKTDMITSMWNEIMHGASGSYYFCLGGWLTEWKDLEGARKQVETPSWKSYMMLNPYAYPVETLDAFKTFMKELEPYRDQVLPFPRFGAPSVAVFFSYPTLIMSHFSKEKVREKMLEWYNAVLFRQYPLQIVFEEELDNLAPSVQALIAPSATYAKPETLRSVEKFLRRGGTVVADQRAFTLDEYGDPQKHPLKGGIHRLNASEETSGEALRGILEKNKVRRYGTVTALSGPSLQQTELHLIDRGDFKLCFLVNMEYLESRDVRITLNVGGSDRFYLTDIINKRTLTQEDSDTWSPDNLRKGFLYTIPAQERVLFILERKRPSDTVFLKPSDLKKLSEAIHAKEAAEVRAFRRKQEEMRKRERMILEKYTGVQEEDCVPISLAGAANRELADPVARDGKGGWMDDGPDYDLSTIRTGKIMAAGIPFEIPDRGKAAIVLLSRHSAYGAEKATGIRIGKRVRSLYFLHAFGWDSPEKTLVMTYVMHYADGTKAEFPIRSGQEIANWWNMPFVDNAKIGVTATAKSGQDINLQCARWQNPHPEKTVTALDIISANGVSVPGIVGITAETFGAAPVCLKQIPGKAKTAYFKKDVRMRTINGNLFIVSFPPELDGGCLISMPRGAMNRPSPAWEIVLNGPADLYLLVHDYGSPEIPEDWKPYPGKVFWGIRRGIGWQKDRIYRKTISGGTVTVPGHNGKGGANYGIPNAIIIRNK